MKLNLKFRIELRDICYKYILFNVMFSIFIFRMELHINGSQIIQDKRLEPLSLCIQEFYILIILLVLMNIIPIIFFLLIKRKKEIYILNNELTFFIFKSIIYIIIILSIGIIFINTFQYDSSNAGLIPIKSYEVSYLKLCFTEEFCTTNGILNIIKILIMLGLELILFNKSYEWKLEFKNKELTYNQINNNNKRTLLLEILKLKTQLRRKNNTFIGVLVGMIIGVIIKDEINSILHQVMWLASEISFNFIKSVIGIGLIYILRYIIVSICIQNKMIESDLSKKRTILLEWENRIK